MGNIFSVDSPSCDQLVQPFLPLLCGKWKHVYNLEENLEALQKEMQDLNAMRNDLSERVSKEEDKGQQGLQEVKGWISMVEEIEPKANRLLDKSVSEIRRPPMYGYGSQNSASTYDYSEDVVMTLKKVEALRSKGNFKVVVDRALPSLLVKRRRVQLAVSQEKVLESAWDRLMDISVGTMGIYGRGGIGKTTILTQIKKKFLEAGVAYGLLIFVVVASEEVESIQEEIRKRLGLKWGRETKREKAAEILRVLEGKRFVLLLDGIQREVDLEEIGVPRPSRENGCKIVFTTRSEEACGRKWVDCKVEVKCLSPEESWDLFQKTVGEKKLRSHPDIPKLARVVASTCRGLPLALDLIGETMARKTTVREWRYTIHVLASSAAGFPDTEDEFLPILKSIYDNMSGENIMLCFLYCALFPKNCDMRKEDVVDYWMGEGIIAKEDREIAEIEGHDMMGDLIRMRLLMEDESGDRVKMPGMVREMAMWIASDMRRSKVNCLVKFGEKINQMLEVDNWSMVRWMSVTSTQIENISDSPFCSELTTLFLQGNSNLKGISGDIFRWMTSLVVMDLSFNRELADLPEEVSSLVSLQFLNLSFTSIKRLPLGLKELRKLIHLDLEHTHELRDINVIASLLTLKVLRLFWSVPLDLSLMEDIQLLKSLKELSLTVKEDAVLERLISVGRRLASCIRRLHLKRITITDGEISLLNAMLSLRELHIDECDFPEVTINRRINTIEMVIPQFQSIRRVSLHRCKGVRDVTWLLLAPNLGDLRISECQQIERITSIEKAEDLGYMSEQPFQNLTRLSLIDLPELESIYWTRLPFPALEVIKIRGCPKLTRPPFNSESAKGKNVQIQLDNSFGEEVFKKLDVAESLLSAGDLQVVAEPTPHTVVERDTVQLIFGLDEKLNRTWSCLMDDGIRMLGLYGMEGVGKTTLLAYIKKKFVEVKDEFDVIIWHKVSKDGDVAKIQDDVGKRLGLYDESWSEKLEREKASDIRTVLNLRKPRFVLLLDDLWKEVNLPEIGIPVTGKQYKVVFTTRFRDICENMGANKVMEVECLAEDDAWDLFKQKAKCGRLNDDISVIAKKVAAKCCGLPLVLQVVGTSLASKTTLNEWRRALSDSTLESSPSKLKGTENGILQVLKLSYDNLREKVTQLCFQYCALFPEPYSISQDELVEYWIGEGNIIDDEDGREKAMDRGYDIIDTLVGAGLLLKDEESKLYMHDMIREMALWIVSEFRYGERYDVQAGAGLSQLPDVKDWITVTKMSLMNNQIEDIPDHPDFHGQAPLITLFLQNNRLVEIVGKFFVFMSSLVVLDLSRNPCLAELPEEISMLVALRYLSLLGTMIKDLPSGLGQLTQLIHLDLESTSDLRSISLISGLSKLQVLRFYDSAAALDISLLKNLERLEGLQLLTVTVREEDVLEAFLGSKLAGKTQGLYLEGLNVPGASLPAIGALDCLSKLGMTECNIMESETEWDDSRRNQYSPSTSSNQIIPSKTWFKNLLAVVLVSCEHLMEVTWLIYAVNLEYLSITLSPKMKELISGKKAAGVGVEPFLKLQVLHLDYLDELRSIYWSPLSFRRLQKARITNCPMLHKLPLDSTSVAKVDDLIIEVDKGWLDKAEWETGSEDRFRLAIRPASVSQLPPV